MSYYTMGIDPEQVRAAGGILPFLYKNGIIILLTIVESQCTGIASSKPDKRPKYAIIRTFNRKQYDTKTGLTNVNLEDYLKEQVRAKFGNCGAPRAIAFEFKGHIYELHKNGKYNYVAKKIDDKNTVNSFTEANVINLLPEAYPIFSDPCKIDKKYSPEYSCVRDPNHRVKPEKGADK